MKRIWMKYIMTNMMRSIRLTLAFCLLFGIGYILVLLAFARIAGPNGGKPELTYSTIRSNMNSSPIVGATNIGQQFMNEKYFWGRPSCAGKDGYDASASGGSNKGPTNKKYLKDVSERTRSFLKAHPYLHPNEIPIEMVTASGSGLDPDITPQSAYIQVRRIATARRVSEKTIMKIVKKSIQKPLLGIFGPEKVNVLRLNITLDKELPDKNSPNSEQYEHFQL